MLKKKILDFKKDLILEEAAKLFQEYGYDNMKVANLAKNIGVSVGSIYTLFGSKENLYHNHILEQIDQCLEKLDNEIQKIDDPIERLKILTNNKFNAYANHENELRTMGFSHPLMFIYASDIGNDVIQHIYAYIDENIMQPLKAKTNTSKTSMEMTLLYDSISIGIIKYWLKFGGDLVGNADEMMEDFLLIAKKKS
ncbi:MAG: TetR/AcrR family transcriptional regulator [Sulfuricurvum sp.]